MPEELRNHPSNIYIREDAVIASVDRWLTTEFNDPDRIAAAAGPDAAEVAQADVPREKLAAVEGKSATSPRVTSPGWPHGRPSPPRKWNS